VRDESTALRPGPTTDKRRRLIKLGPEVPPTAAEKLYDLLLGAPWEEQLVDRTNELYSGHAILLDGSA
jgi:hypothetical protein